MKDDHVRRLTELVPGLRDLRLLSCSGLTKEALHHVGRLSQLQAFGWGRFVGDLVPKPIEGLEAVCALPALESLEVEAIWDAAAIDAVLSAHGLRHLTLDCEIGLLLGRLVPHLSSLPRLEKLNLKDQRLSDAELLHLARALARNVQVLRLTLCRGFTADGVRAVREARPDLTLDVWPKDAETDPDACVCVPLCSIS